MIIITITQLQLFGWYLTLVPIICIRNGRRTSIGGDIFGTNDGGNSHISFSSSMWYVCVCVGS